MPTLLSRIKANSKYLPKKDLKYADKFIGERNFEALYELVSADHKIHDRKRNPDGLFEDDEDVRMDQILTELEGDVLSYVRLIEPDYEVVNEDEFDECYSGEDLDW